MLADFLQDLRLAARVLARRPAFLIVSILTLTVGIAGNTAIFSMVDALLIRPLPYPESGRLVSLGETVTRLDRALGPTSRTTFLDWRRGCRSFTSAGAYIFYPGFGLTLTGQGEPKPLEIGFVTPDLLGTLGVAPALGRAFAADEGRAGAPPVVLLSDRLWRERFAASAAALGRSVTLEGTPYTVVGVMPSGFAFPSAVVDAWVPLGLGAADEEGRRSREIAALARLRPGVSVDAARAEVEAVTAGIAAAHPETMEGRGAVVRSLHELVAAPVRPALLALLGAVGFVLLIACANVSNLLLASLGARQKEMALRAALGARRGRLVRQLLTESALLAATGGGLGLLGAYWTLDLLRRLAPPGLAWLGGVTVDPAALLFTLALSLLASALFGLLPALHAARTDLVEALREGSRVAWAASGRRSTRSVLLVLEVALSFVLLAGAGLMLRSLDALRRVDPGFDPRGVVTLHCKLPTARYATAASQIRFFESAVSSLSALPGVAAAGATSELPITGFHQKRNVFVAGRAPARPGERVETATRYVHAGYFPAMAIALLEGRLFDGRDGADSEPVALVSRAAARRLWPDRGAVGERLSFEGPNGPWREVVGVVGDTREFGLAGEKEAIVYQPLAQRPEAESWMSWITLVARAGSPGGAAAVAPAARARVRALDGDLAFGDARTMQQVLAASEAARRFDALLLGAFALVALFLAAVGLYGVISLSVSGRSHEIGIRMALGARAGGIVALVLREGMGLTLAGIGAGAVAALLLTRLLSSLLFGVAPGDPATFAAIALLFAAVAFLACVVPARRAARVDPTTALRME